MPLSRHSVETYLETSSHATRQETLIHSRLISLSHCGLVLASTVETRRRGMNGQTFSQNPRKRGKSHHYHLRCTVD